jgi:hypothetical protein
MEEHEETGQAWGSVPPHESGDTMDAATADGFGRGEMGDGFAPRGAKRVARDFGERVENRLNWGFGAAAGRLEDTALRIDRFADERTATATGATARAGTLAHSLADLMEATADFLRNSDVESLRDDVRRQMHDRPVQTLLIGVAAGWAMGKILR